MGELALVARGSAYVAVGESARVLLHALARDEAAGRCSSRLTEAGLATWRRFRGRLGSTDLLRLLSEDAAVGHPIPFDLRRYAAELELARMDDELVDAWLRDLPSLDPGAGGVLGWYVARPAARKQWPLVARRLVVTAAVPH
jgi:hypothetical protein